MNLELRPAKIHQLPPPPGPPFRASPRQFSHGEQRDLYSAQDQVIKKWFVILDWIDHLFPKFLFPSFTHYTPSADGRGHLLAPAFIALANGNTLAAAFPEGCLIYLPDKRVKFSKGQKN